MRITTATRVTLVALMVLATGAGVLQAQTQLHNVTVNYGGARSASASYQATLTIQPIVGESASSTEQCRLGFWSGFYDAFVSGVMGMPTYQNQLLQNSPNPFNPRTTIRFTLDQEAPTRIEVFDLRGRRVARLLDEIVSAGAHSLVWQPENLASGVYFLRLQAGSFNATSRLVLLK
jgi:hypothetical protein